MHCVKAQQVTLPVHFDQYYNNAIITNPARVAESNGLRFNRRALSGPFKNVTSLLGSYQHQITKESSRNEQHIGLAFINEKEGGFLNRTRIYGGYSWSTLINEKWRFTGGALMGMFNYFIKSSNTSAGGSALSPDLQMGVWMNTKGTGLGIAMNQLLNNSMSPFGTPIRLIRHYTLGISHKVDLVDKFQMKFYANSVLNNYRNEHRVNALLGYKGGVEAGTGLVYRKGLVVTAGLSDYKLSDNRRLDFGASYFLPTGVFASQISKVLEISLGIR